MELVSYKDPKVVIKEIRKDTSFERASEDLKEATLQVAQAAENLANNADRVPAFLADYLVDVEDMDRLKAALSIWQKASSNLLKQL